MGNHGQSGLGSHWKLTRVISLKIATNLHLKSCTKLKQGQIPPFPLLCQMPLIPYGVNFFFSAEPPSPHPAPVLPKMAEYYGFPMTEISSFPFPGQCKSPMFLKRRRFPSRFDIFLGIEETKRKIISAPYFRTIFEY